MRLNELTLTTDYLDLDPLFFHEVAPTPLKRPHLISFNPDAARLIDLDVDSDDDLELVNVLNGSHLFQGSRPFAMCYAGHQFGHYVPRLGDGRAINLGRANGWDLQLKGAGITRYSRQGDGRAVLRSSIREYLMSEAMHGLGIPTTRALALIGSDEDVARERWEKGAIVLRLSPTWVRFGSFEYFAQHTKTHPHLETLAEFAIAEAYPELIGEKDHFFLMYEQVVQRTAKLLAQWQSVGFNHGVMNTDNMSIAGLTIDYGPYAFLDDYDFDYICNHTDHEGRYSFGNQPPVAHWNLNRLKRALAPIISIDRMEKALETFGPLYSDTYLRIMFTKLGLQSYSAEDEPLLRRLMEIMQQHTIDYTRFFRLLSHYDGDRKELLALTPIPSHSLVIWLDSYDERLGREALSHQERCEKMLATNPNYVLKNYMLQEAIDKAEKGDFSGVDALMKIALAPFDEHPGLERFSRATPDQAKNLKLSCSS